MLGRVARSIRRFASLNAYTTRTHNCGELRAANEGEHVVLVGWLAYKRMNRFLVLRDSYGTVQASVPLSSQFSKIIKDIPYESVVQIEGIVKNRGDDKSEKMSTGEIEVDVAELTILNKADPNLPLHPNSTASEKTRLQYRYLDVRGDTLQRALRIRSTMVHKMQNFLAAERGFVGVDTPTLFRRTPGGAAEFLVPAGAPNKGSCYSLPQSPQQFKQLLMVGGIDRYYQIARCYRDEGSKGDRQPEFTQVDLEMSFTTQQGVMSLVEDTLLASWPDHLADLKPSAPFPYITYKDAMELYGSDKPDMRIPWEIKDATEILEGLRPQNATKDWCARIILCKGQADVATGSHKKEWKRLIEMNTLGRPFAAYTTSKKQWFKFVDNRKLMQTFEIKDDDLVVFSWGDDEGVQWTLGQLRNLVADVAGLRKQRAITCHWMVNFPLFSYESGQLVSTHHPFTAPIAEHREWLNDESKLRHITGQHYDLVVNGVEMGGGSIRIHNAEEQKHVLNILKEDTSEMTHLLDALAYGAPPHGGFALGLDRYAALMAGNGDPSVPVRDVIAFPKTKEGRDLMCGAPVHPSEVERARYGVRFVEEK